MATLIINNKKEFDQQVWQTETGFKGNNYNSWLQGASDNLQKIYNYLEDKELPWDIDIYGLGDIINLLGCINIESEHMAETWTVTAGDFDNYDTSELSEEAMNDLIDRAAHIAQNDGMGEYYFDAIRVAAEEAGLKEVADKETTETESADEYSHEELVAFIKENCNIKQWQKGQALDCMEHRYPLPDSITDAIDVAITEFCIENDIDNDLVLGYEDAEDLFFECFT